MSEKPYNYSEILLTEQNYDALGDDYEGTISKTQFYWPVRLKLKKTWGKLTENWGKIVGEITLYHNEASKKFPIRENLVNWEKRFWSTVIKQKVFINVYPKNTGSDIKNYRVVFVEKTDMEHDGVLIAPEATDSEDF